MSFEMANVEHLEMASDKVLVGMRPDHVYTKAQAQRGSIGTVHSREEAVMK